MGQGLGLGLLLLAEHVEGDGATVYQHAAALGCEGIVSKRKGSRYVSGRSPDWIKTKKPGRASSPARGGRGLGPLKAGAREPGA